MMRESLNDKLSGFLDIENKIEETSKNVVKKQESNIQEFNSSEMREQDLANDYNEHRETLKDLVSQGQDALQNLLQLAKESEHPRAYEVTGQLLKTTADLTKDLIELQVTMNKIENTKDGGKPSKVVNNAVFVGNTNDLLETLRGKNREVGKNE
jgi:hypothetical protein|tara:strand:- start:2468 stop:2929 length:462 start_codon:yes stop_codon:yes gene_type:complete